MTTHDRDKVIAAANEVGFYEETDFDGSKFNSMPEACWAKFYAIAFEAGRQAEREECAKVCEALGSDYKGRFGEDDSLLLASSKCAKVIRARSTK